MATELEKIESLNDALIVNYKKVIDLLVKAREIEAEKFTLLMQLQGSNNQCKEKKEQNQTKKH